MALVFIISGRRDSLAVFDLPLLDFLLTSTNHVVNFASNALNLVLAVKTSSNLFIGFNETLEFLLEAVVLVVQVCHVLVQCINFGLKLDLILVHLVRMKL